MSDEDVKEDARQTKPFAGFLQEHNRGAGHRHASEALQRVVAAVQDTGKKGSVVVTVNLEPMKGNDDALLTTVNVVEKIPVTPPKAAVFYADADHNLQRTDPQQLQFEGLKGVEGPEVRETKPAPAVKVGE